MKKSPGRCNRQRRLKKFLAKLTNGTPAEYYVQHVKNLAIVDYFFKNKEVNHILAICSGVESLVILTGLAWGFDFLKNTQAVRQLRRLAITLSHFGYSQQRGLTSSTPVFPT